MFLDTSYNQSPHQKHSFEFWCRISVMLFVVENKQPIKRQIFAAKIQSYVFDVVIIGLVGLSTL